MQRVNPTLSQPIQTSPIWRIPSIVEGIVDACAPEDHANLGRVSRALHAAVNRPTAWARQYAPSQIDFGLRTIFTATSSVPEDTGSTAKPKRRTLGQYGGSDWYLSTARPLQFPTDAQSIRRLDRANEFDPFHEHKLIVPVLSGDKLINQMRRERQAIYSYLIDRGYLRSHNKAPLDCFHRSTPVFLFFNASLCFLLLKYLSAIPEQSNLMQSLGFAIAFGPFMGSVVGTAWCANSILLHLVRYVVLNHYADKFYREAVEGRVEPLFEQPELTTTSNTQNQDP